MNRSFEYVFNGLVLMAFPSLSEITTKLNPQSRGINEAYRIGRVSDSIPNRRMSDDPCSE